jgi:hypothetical protein
VAVPAFCGLSGLLLAVSALCVAFLGKRADVVLPKIREWMDSHAWVVSEIVLVFFAALTISSIVKG